MGVMCVALYDVDIEMKSDIDNEDVTTLTKDPRGHMQQPWTLKTWLVMHLRE
jgi:hypothetical protein